MFIISMFATAGIIPIICFILGLIFIVIEMLHPGISAPGIAGGILLIIGVILTARTLLEAVVLIAILLVILGSALAVVIRSVTRGRLSRALILNDTLKKENIISGMDNSDCYIGREGIALTPLRPSGTANFDGEKLDVVTEGEFVEKGSCISIVKLEARKITVSKV